MNILITGACGVTSRAIVRSLKVSPKFKQCHFLGTDICENVYGIFEGLYDRIYKVPSSSSPNYREKIEQIIQKEYVDAAIITPEPEVLYWAENPLDVSVIVPPPKFCRIAINKSKLYKSINGTDLIPNYDIISKNDLLIGNLGAFNKYPIWVRDFSEGTTSGKGAFKVNNQRELEAWIILNQNIERYLVSEFLPGNNYACHLLYCEGKLLRVASYERLVYFMGHTVMSGISGNISRGRLINNSIVRNVAEESVDAICKITGETMHGLVTIDMKCNDRGKPMVTEINLRHVAATSAFASAGCYIAQDQLLCALGKAADVSAPIEVQYPPNNMILRDIDGTPIWLSDYAPLKIGQCWHSDGSRVLMG
jgi:carbamoylphosphate synthase large subunit